MPNPEQVARETSMTHEPRPTAVTFATNIIEGPGGLNDFENREVATSPHSDRVWAAIWTLRCLANPQCEGSGQALAAIMEQRNGLPTARPTLTADDPAGWWTSVLQHGVSAHKVREAFWWDGLCLYKDETKLHPVAVHCYTDFIGPLTVQPGYAELREACRHIFGMIEVELYESPESNEWHRAAKMLQRALAAAEAGDNQERKKP